VEFLIMQQYSIVMSEKIEPAIKLESSTEINMVVHGKYLLLLYIVVPIAVILIGIDRFLLDDALNNGILSQEPGKWFLWTLLFGMPHAVASFISLADREYLAHYKRKLLIPIPVIILGSAVTLLVFGEVVFFLIYISYTLYHLLAQQVGIAMMLLKKKPVRNIFWWKWLSVVASIGIFIAAFKKDYLMSFIYGGIPLVDIINVTCALLICAASFFAYEIFKTANPKLNSNRKL
jgi:hypothetical protein